MWKLVSITLNGYFPICYDCANFIQVKFKDFDFSKKPNKKEIVAKSKISFEKRKKYIGSYGN